MTQHWSERSYRKGMRFRVTTDSFWKGRDGELVAINFANGDHTLRFDTPSRPCFGPDEVELIPDPTETEERR